MLLTRGMHGQSLIYREKIEKDLVAKDEDILKLESSKKKTKEKFAAKA